MSKLENSEIQIHDFIEELVEPYAEMAEMEEHNFETDLKANGSFVVDKSRLHQLIVILLDNAIKYSDDEDTVKIATDFDKKGNLVVSVSDTGRGISDEAKKHIFERFYREDKSGNRETSGTGLGLSIAKWIVDAFEGRITVTNNQPKGTVFTIVIPQQEA